MTPNMPAGFSTEAIKGRNGGDPQVANANFAGVARLLAKSRHNSGVHALFDQYREEAAFVVPLMAVQRQAIQVEQ